mgnify:CR=1 FL=1
MRYSKRITYDRSGCSRIMQPPTQPGQNTGAPVSQVVGAPMGGQVIAPMGGQVTTPMGGQVIYVHFKPSPNFRHISYMVLGGGLLLSFIGMMLSYNSSSFEDGFFLMNCAIVIVDELPYSTTETRIPTIRHCLHSIRDSYPIYLLTRITRGQTPIGNFQKCTFHRFTQNDNCIHTTSSTKVMVCICFSTVIIYTRFIVSGKNRGAFENANICRGCFR